MFKHNFSYENPIYAPLKESARKVISAYQKAARWLDAIQEWLYIEFCVLVNGARKDPHKYCYLDESWRTVTSGTK